MPGREWKRVWRRGLAAHTACSACCACCAWCTGLPLWADADAPFSWRLPTKCRCPPPAPLLRSAPSVSPNNATASFTSIDVAVTPPALAPIGGWAQYKLELCPTLPAGTCFSQDCSNLPQPSPTTTTCQVTGLVPGTGYSVAATAVNGSLTTLAPAKSAFRTLVE